LKDPGCRGAIRIKAMLPVPAPGAPVAPEAAELPKPFGLALGVEPSESTEAAESAEEAPEAPEAPEEENTSQFLVIPGANSVSTSHLQQALADQLQALNQLVQSCNDIFREDGGMRMSTSGLSVSPEYSRPASAPCGPCISPISPSPPILGTRPGGPSAGGMHLPDKALPEVHMVPPVPHWGYQHHQHAVPKQKSQKQGKQVTAHAPAPRPRTAKAAGKNKVAKVKEVAEVKEVKQESFVAHTTTGKGGRYWKEKVPKTESEMSKAAFQFQ